MKRNYTLLIILVFVCTNTFAQDVPLFKTKEPINLRATGSIKSIKKKSNDSTFVTGKFQYQQDSNQWRTVDVKSRVRGNFRLRYCYFPPMKLKFTQQDVASTV